TSTRRNTPRRSTRLSTDRCSAARNRSTPPYRQERLRTRRCCKFSCGLLPLERKKELSPEARRDVLVVQAVAFRPLVLGKIVGSEQPVDPRKVDGKVLVDRLALRRVMPVMVSRLDQERFQPFNRRPEIAVRPGRMKRHEQQVRDVDVV